MRRGKDGQTLFHRILLDTDGGQLHLTTAIDWHLKVKDIEFNLGLNKNYCITVSTPPISLICS